MNNFKLEGRPYVELCDLLKLTGLCSSGGVAKHLIAEGSVVVDGKIELRKRCKIRNGQAVVYQETTITVIE